MKLASQIKKSNTQGRMLKTRGSYKLCIMLSALGYSKPQQLKIAQVISSWRHRSSTRTNLGEQSSTTHLKGVALQRKPFFCTQRQGEQK